MAQDCLLDHLVVGRNYRVTLTNPSVLGKILTGSLRSYCDTISGPSIWLALVNSTWLEWILLSDIARVEEIP